MVGDAPAYRPLPGGMEVATSLQGVDYFLADRFIPFFRFLFLSP